MRRADGGGFQRPEQGGDLAGEVDLLVVDGVAQREDSLGVAFNDEVA